MLLFPAEARHSDTTLAGERLMSTTLSKRSDVGALAAVEPVSLWQSLLLFGIPAVLFRLVLYNGTGWLVTHGVAEVVAVLLPE
jgi:hypothetical protein